MSDELSNRVKHQIEELLKEADKPGIDVKAMLDRASGIFEERLPGFLAAIVTEALVEQIAKYGRDDICCKHFRGLYLKCKRGKMAGEACLSCDDYEPARRRK